MKLTATVNNHELTTLSCEGYQQAFEKPVRRQYEKFSFSIPLFVKAKCLTKDLFQKIFIKIYKSVQKRNCPEEGKSFPWVLKAVGC